jgi:glycosyltransferase 2 family protein
MDLRPQGRVSWRLLLLGVSISSGFLILLLRKLEWNQFWGVLTRINGRILVVPIAAMICGSLLKPLRWQKIFPSQMKPSFRLCFGALSVGNMANSFLPARGGDLLRCFLVARKSTLTGGSTVLATVGLEKILDGLALLGVLLISFWFFTPPRWLGRLGMVSGLLFGGALGVAFVVHSRSSWVLALTHSVFRKLRLKPLGEQAAGLFERFAQGLAAINCPTQMAGLVVLSVVIWIADAVGVWGLACALSISVSIPGAVLVSAVVGLSLMIPAGPGSIGTYEFFSVAALKLLGVEFASAMALTVLMHAWSLATAMMLGAGGLGACGIDFAWLVRPDIKSVEDEFVFSEKLLKPKP